MAAVPRVPVIRAVFVISVVCLAVLVAVPPVSAAPDDGVHLLVSIDGKRVGHERVVLTPDAATRMVVTVSNGSQEPVRIASIRTSGSVLGLTFFVFNLSVPLEVPPQRSATWPVEIDTRELDGQATGLLPITVALRDTDRNVIVSADGNADIRGSLASVYGLFGLGLLCATGLLLGAVLLALARQRLPANRWRRALRFVPGGCGVGGVAVVTLSVLKVTAPSTTSELVFVVGAAAVAFAAGYLTPAPSSARPPAGGRPERPPGSRPPGSRPPGSRPPQPGPPQPAAPTRSPAGSPAGKAGPPVAPPPHQYRSGSR